MLLQLKRSLLTVAVILATLATSASADQKSISLRQQNTAGTAGGESRAQTSEKTWAQLGVNFASWHNFLIMCEDASALGSKAWRRRAWAQTNAKPGMTIETGKEILAGQIITSDEGGKELSVSFSTNCVVTLLDPKALLRKQMQGYEAFDDEYGTMADNPYTYLKANDVVFKVITLDPNENEIVLELSKFHSLMPW